MNEHIQVAETIKEQLGGSRFTSMTGAKGFLADDEQMGALSFHLPRQRGFVRNGINHVKIVLTWKDLYDITFSRIGRTVQVVEKATDIYCDELQDCFTRVTGLATHL